MSFRWYKPGGPDLAQQQSLAMAGYTPRPNSNVPMPSMQGYVPSRTPDAVEPPPPPYVGLGGEGGAERGRMWGANNYGQGAAYNELNDLRAEYERNNARITEIENRLKFLSSRTVDDKTAYNRSMDELDHKLAISRANAGDVSGAYNHLARIDNRKLTGNRSDSDKKTELKTIVEDLETAYIMRNAEDDAIKQAGWDNKIARLEKEYRDLAGKDYQYLGVNPDSRVYGLGDKALDKAAIMSKVTTFQGARKDKRLTEDQIAELFNDVSRMPNGPDKNEMLAKIYEWGRDSAENYDRRVADFDKKLKNAKQKLLDGWDGLKIKKDIGKIPGKSVDRTQDGIKFTITYIGISPVTGKKKFEISRNGKVLATREED